MTMMGPADLHPVALYDRISLDLDLPILKNRALADLCTFREFCHVYLPSLYRQIPAAAVDLGVVGEIAIESSRDYSGRGNFEDIQPDIILSYLQA